MAKAILLLTYLNVSFACMAQDSSYISFESDGTKYSLIADSDSILSLTRLRYVNARPQDLVVYFINKISGDSLMLSVSDKNGLPERQGGSFSPNTQILFVYAMKGRGRLRKMLNTDQAFDSNNFLLLSNLQLRDSGLVQGEFQFSNLNFTDPAGKVVARIPGISNGRFRAFITDFPTATADIETEQKTFSEQLSPSAKLLFYGVENKISIVDKNKIAALLNFTLTGNTDLPFAMDKESIDYPFDASMKVLDLNHDGVEEVFVQFGNTFTSGATGSSIVLLVKDKIEGYKINLGFPGTMPSLLKSVSKTYPDLLVGGPGFDWPVYRWNGKEYVFLKTQKVNP